MPPVPSERRDRRPTEQRIVRALGRQREVGMTIPELANRLGLERTSVARAVHALGAALEVVPCECPTRYRLSPREES